MFCLNFLIKWIQYDLDRLRHSIFTNYYNYIKFQEYKTECSCITAWTDKSPLSRLGDVNALTCTPYGWERYWVCYSSGYFHLGNVITLSTIWASLDQSYRWSICWRPKCNKFLNVVRFCPKFNKPAMQSLNCDVKVTAVALKNPLTSINGLLWARWY